MSWEQKKCFQIPCCFHERASMSPYRTCSKACLAGNGTIVLCFVLFDRLLLQVIVFPEKPPATWHLVYYPFPFTRNITHSCLQATTLLSFSFVVFSPHVSKPSSFFVCVCVRGATLRFILKEHENIVFGNHFFFEACVFENNERKTRKQQKKTNKREGCAEEAVIMGIVQPSGRARSRRRTGW